MTPRTEEISDNESLRELARILAKGPEPIESENGTCVLCKRSVSCSHREDDHEKNCPWRMARYWYSAGMVK
jgi:hypothetical protein